jgi:hypothetical protein
MESFDIYFLGEILPDADPAKVRAGVAKLFKVQETAVDRLFSGKPLRVKQAVDAESAGRYRSAFRDVGALIQIVATGAPPPKPAAPPQPATRPPTVQSESDEQAIPPPAQVEEAGSFDLAEPGAIIDHSEPAAPANIDTSALEALPPNTGSLEDCRNEKPPRKIPDISHLQLIDD